MVTKADAFRREQQAKQRKKNAKPKKPKKPKQRDVDTAEPGVSATDVRRGEHHTADRNRSMHAQRKAAVVLEDSESGKPSRKSSRKSANRLKMAASLEKEAARRLNTPKAKATRARARAR